jgi:sulfur-oxidizing protein SoxX
MPAYHRVRSLKRVASEWQGKPVLDAQQVEDVLAWLLTLDEEAP